MTSLPPVQRTGDGDMNSAHDVGAERWVHAANAQAFRGGDFFVWRDDSSPTGFYGGDVVGSDPRALRVLVRNVVAGVLRHG